MIGLGEADVPDRLAPLPVWASQLLFGTACAAVIVGERFLVDRVAPGIGPFSIMYPALMISTLFGRWQSGVVTAVIVIVFVWYAVLPPSNSFAFEREGDVARTVVNAITSFIIVALAELARRSFRSAVKERNVRIDEQALLLREIDHRVKNNFAIVVSLIGLQRRQAADPATQEALSTALSRVESVARAHNHLYGAAAGTAAVDMQVYISELCAALKQALFLGDAVTLACTCDPVSLQRDRAVAVGLVVNELVTNAAKHAFQGRETGEIRVALRSSGAAVRLSVADNGIGLPPVRRDGALGQRLIDGFSRQANGALTSKSDAGGTVFVLELPL